MSILSYVAAMLGTIFVAMVLYYVLQIIAYWKVFTKAGEPGWKSLIPFYNIYIQYKISWNPMMFFLGLACVIAAVVLTPEDGSGSAIASVLSTAAIVINVMAVIKLSKAFGHGIGFALGLFFFQPIFTMILGLGSSTYQGPQ